MSTYFPHELLNNRFLLTAERTIFWENENALIVSDLHMGKTGHFRKSGIPVPQSVLKEDMQRLFSQIQFYHPTQLIIVGDLFHSDANKEHDLFIKWRNDLGRLQVHLIKGNHDILEPAWYTAANITVHEHSLTIGDFTFVHDINDYHAEEKKYCFSGHIHPGITVRGMGRQSVHLSCFYFGKEYAILPAFGKFTGTYTVEPGKGDAVFGLANKTVIRIQ